MNSNSLGNFKTVIHTLCILGGVLFYDSPVFAQGTSAGTNVIMMEDRKERVKLCKENFTEGTQELKDCVASAMGMTNADKKSENCTTTQVDKVNDAIKDMQKACTLVAKDSQDVSSSDEAVRAYKPDKNCAQRYKKCLPKSASDKDRSNAFAGILNMSTADLRENCMDSPKSYLSQREKIEGNIKSLETDIQSQEDKITDAETSHKDKLLALQEKMNDEKKKVDDLKEKMDEKKAEEEQKSFEAGQTRTANTLKLQNKKTDLRAQLRQANTKAQAALLTASDAVAKSKCMLEVQKYKNENKTALKSNSVGALTSNGNSAKAVLEQQFNTCMATFNLQRQDIAATLTENISKITAQMDEVDQTLAQIDAANTQAESQRQTRLQQMDTKTQKAIQDATTGTQQLQSQVQESSRLLQQKESSIRKRLQSLEGQKDLKNSQLIGLGRIADDGDLSSDKSLKNLVDAYNEGLQRTKSYVLLCCKSNPSKPELCSTAEAMAQADALRVGNK